MLTRGQETTPVLRAGAMRFLLSRLAHNRCALKLRHFSSLKHVGEQQFAHAEAVGALCRISVGFIPGGGGIRCVYLEREWTRRENRGRFELTWIGTSQGGIHEIDPNRQRRVRSGLLGA